MAWLLLKPVIGTKNKRQNKTKKQVYKSKRMGEGEGEGIENHPSSLKELTGGKKTKEMLDVEANLFTCKKIS